MASTEQEQVDEKTKIFILPNSVNIVESYNLDTKKEEPIEEELTCSNCPTFLLTPGYCHDKKIGVSPRYHCKKSENIRKIIEEALT